MAAVFGVAVLPACGGQRGGGVTSAAASAAAGFTCVVVGFKRRLGRRPVFAVGARLQRWLRVARGPASRVGGRLLKKTGRLCVAGFNVVSSVAASRPVFGGGGFRRGAFTKTRGRLVAFSNAAFGAVSFGRQGLSGLQVAARPLKRPTSRLCRRNAGRRRPGGTASTGVCPPRRVFFFFFFFGLPEPPPPSTFLPFAPTKPHRPENSPGAQLLLLSQKHVSFAYGEKKKASLSFTALANPCPGSRNIFQVPS